MKRYRIQPTHFDTRVHSLKEPKETWAASAIAQHGKNKSKLVESLKNEFGEINFELKLSNFKDLGPLPFSIVSHHNHLLEQGRSAFIQGYYYPALTAACALGERILNHLLLDLREHYPTSSFDKKSHRRNSIDDWTKAIKTFDEWGILQSEKVRDAFENLSELRHRSIHFNPETIKTLREDSLKAFSYLSDIIEGQFGFLLDKIIPGTKGAFFLKKEEEQDPFIKKYYLTQSFYVSPHHAFRYLKYVTCVFDYKIDNSDEIEDMEFVKLFNTIEQDERAPTQIPWTDDVVAFALIDNEIRRLECGSSEMIV